MIWFFCMIWSKSFKSIWKKITNLILRPYMFWVWLVFSLIRFIAYNFLLILFSFVASQLDVGVDLFDTFLHSVLSPVILFQFMMFIQRFFDLLIFLQPTGFHSIILLTLPSQPVFMLLCISQYHHLLFPNYSWYATIQFHEPPHRSFRNFSFENPFISFLWMSKNSTVGDNQFYLESIYLDATFSLLG